MVRGTNPIHTFTIPFDVDLVKEVRIIYAQDDQIVFVKNTEDCILENNTITAKLEQTETLSLDSRKPVEIQVRVLTVGGESLVSGIKSVSVGRCLDDEVLE